MPQSQEHQQAVAHTTTLPTEHALGVNLFHQGKYEEAVRIFSQLLNEGENSELWNDWAAAQTGAGQLAEAKRGFEKALTLDPSNQEASANLDAILRSSLTTDGQSHARRREMTDYSSLSEQTKRNWDFSNRRQLLYALVGYDFGPEPETRLGDIRAYKRRESAFLLQALNFTPDDTVLDLGSGCGFVARVVAPLCKRVHCLDISSEFLSFAREELQEFPNVEFHRMEFGNLHCLDHTLAGQPITKGYANAVFIHFNFFDIVVYLREIHRILSTGGLFLFGMSNTDSLDLKSDKYFSVVLEHYLRDRACPTLMHWNSAKGVCRAARQIGFDAKELWSGEGTAMILLRKLP